MLTIRPAIAADAPAIIYLIQSHARSCGETSPLDESYVKHYLSHPNSHILLAELDGQTAGLLSYSLRPDLFHASTCCWGEEIIIREELRRQGIGSALVNYLIQSLQAEGVVEIAVGIMPDNQASKQLSRHFGISEEAVLLERHFI